MATGVFISSEILPAFVVLPAKNGLDTPKESAKGFDSNVCPISDSDQKAAFLGHHNIGVGKARMRKDPGPRARDYPQ